jgi:hypothetical protein
MSLTASINTIANTATNVQPRARSPYDWSLERPGAHFHIDPVSEQIPADLDPHIAPGMVSVPVEIRLAASRPTRLELVRATALGITATALIAALAATAFTAAAIRLPAVQQASIDAAGV